MPNQVLDIKIMKNLNGGGSNGEWSNSYQVETDLATDSPEMAQVANKLAQMERSFHLNIVTFTRAIVSTYKKEQAPNELDDSTEVPLAFNGQVVEAVDEDGKPRTLPGEIVLVVKRKSKGRTSRVTYRHAIAHNEWSGAGGGVTLTQAKIDAVQGALGGYLSFDNRDATLVKANKTSPLGTPGYLVTSMSVVGTANRQLDARRKPKKKAGSEVPETPDTLGGAVGNSLIDWVSAIYTTVQNSLPDPTDLARLSVTAYNIVVRATQAYNELRRTQNLPVLPMPEPPALPPAP